MSIFPRMGQRTKIILPIRSNLATYNEIPEHTEITTTTTIPSVQDGPTVVARYRNLTISNGATLTTSHRCCGLVLVINGDLVIGGNSAISMTARGASFVPTGNHLIKNDLFPVKDIVYEIDIPATADEIAAFLKSEKRKYHHIDELPAIYRPTLYALTPTGVFTPDVLGEVPRVGGAGGAALTGAGDAGAAGTDRKCGGGGSGAQASSGVQGKGGKGTPYSGGSGGGGGYGSVGSDDSHNGSDYGGPGGVGVASVSDYAGGGAGNPGGAGSESPTTSNGANGTGGLLVVICTGKITNNGAISSSGSRGGNAWRTGGGGSGGGSINIFYGTIENNGAISAAGGAGGTAGSYVAGGAGGAGCVTIDQYNF